MTSFQEQIKMEWERLRSGFLKNFIRSYEQQKKDQNEVPPRPRSPWKGPVEEPPPETPNVPQKTPVEEPPREL